MTSVVFKHDTTPFGFKRCIVVKRNMLKSFALLEAYNAVIHWADANSAYDIFDAADHLREILFSILSSGI